MPGTITFQDASASNLANADRVSTSDPYVKWSTGAQEVQTDHLRNMLGRTASNTPHWDSEEYSVAYYEAAGAEVTITVQVWDHDRGADDLLGEATVTVTLPAPNEIAEVDFADVPLTKVPGGRQIKPSTVSFTVVVEADRRAERPSRMAALHSVDPVAAAPPADPAPPVVKRQEIRRMPEAEQERYMAALLKMMENKGGEAETSAFFELAGYHGWPGNGNERMYSYCEHRQETFPGWHRAYLVAFEKGLQEADRALGNDGQIALPYW